METIDEYLAHVPVSNDKLRALGFFDAPASKGHHLAVKGGLAIHSVNVTTWLLKLTETMGVKWPRPESPYIVGMLHDLVKCKCYTLDEQEVEIAWDMRREKKIVIAYKQPAYPGHGVASALIITAELGLMLLPAEQAAIVGHMGAFCLADNELKEYDAMLDAYPREIIATHTADMLASRVDEVTIITPTKEVK